MDPKQQLAELMNPEGAAERAARAAELQARIEALRNAKQ